MTNHYLIRDHKGLPARIEAVNFTDACQKLKLVPAKCTAEVLDTTVPYQKWDVVDVKQEMRAIPRKPTTQRQVSKGKPKVFDGIHCLACDKELTFTPNPRHISARNKKFCNGNCRIRYFRSK